MFSLEGYRFFFFKFNFSENPLSTSYYLPFLPYMPIIRIYSKLHSDLNKAVAACLLNNDTFLKSYI